MRFSLLLLSALVFGQSDYKITTTTQLVVVDVAVKDSSGKPVTGLTASDFSITEDGKPQRVGMVEYQKLDDTPLPPRQLATRTEGPSLKSGLAPSKAGEIQYKDRRLLVLFFDQAGMPVADQYRAQQAALRFLNTQMTASDVVAVMTYSTSLKVTQDFTGDRDQLTAAVKALRIGDTGLSNGSTGSDADADTSAAYTQDDTEFNVFNTDRKLAALTSAVKMLANLPEKKAMVYFASGMTLTGIDNQAQLRSTINAAIRSNVAFYPVDARGLVGTAPMGDATTGSPGGQAMYSGNSQRASRDNFQAQQDTLYTLASDTGGKALLDNNDLAMGIAQAHDAVMSYYILGYYSTNTEPDGRYRRVKVKINRTLDAKLDYRSGYFASKTFRHFDASDRERQLQEALMLEDPVTDLAVAMEVNYFRLGKDRYFIPVSLKIPGRDLELARKSGAETTRLDFIGQVKDAKGMIQGNVRDEITVKLKGENLGLLAQRNLDYDTGFTLRPGTYDLKMLAREDVTGKMGTFETRFAVPDLTADQRYLPISSVVLGYQREKLSAAVATAQRDKKLAAANPLVQDEFKLIPSVTRVFRTDQEMFVYLEAYQPQAAATQYMTATVAFYRGKQKAFESAPLRISEGLKSTSKAVPVSFTLPLAEIHPGHYTCQVSVLNPEAKKFATWRSPVVVLPQ